MRSLSLPRLSGPSCPIDFLAAYVGRTAALRQKDSDVLFLALKRPHNEVGSSTAARWIKQGLISAGITEILGPIRLGVQLLPKQRKRESPLITFSKQLAGRLIRCLTDFIFARLIITKLRSVYSHNQRLIFKVSVKLERILEI